MGCKGNDLQIYICAQIKFYDVNHSKISCNFGWIRKADEKNIALRIHCVSAEPFMGSIVHAYSGSWWGFRVKAH